MSRALLRHAPFLLDSTDRTRTGKSRTSNAWTGMNNLLWWGSGRDFVISFFDNMRNLAGTKVGSVLIVFVIFISAETLGRRGVKSHWACARLFPPPFERGQGWANCAANSSPVKRPVDWAVPHNCTHHAAHMREDLLGSIYLLRISFQGRAPSRF